MRTSGGLLRALLVYGAGDAGVRLIGLLLLPLFTAYLTPDDYGIIALLGILMMVLVSLASLGLGTSFGIVYFARADARARSEVVASAVGVVALAAVAVIIAGISGSGALARFVLGTDAQRLLVTFTILSAAAAIVTQPLMQAVQFEGRARTFVLLSAVSSLLTIGLALVLVVGFRRGVRGWVEADLLARLGTLALFGLATLLRDRVRPRLDAARELVRLGLPVLPGAGFVFILQQSNKYILQRMAGLGAAGVYNVGFNLGNAALGLPIGALQRAWTPHFMSFADRPDAARREFARIMTLYVFAFGGLALLAVIGARAGVLLLTQPAFHDAYKVVGPVALAQVFFGAFLLLLPGPYFARHVSGITFVQAMAAAVSVAANVALIRIWGLMGAAVGLAVGAAAQAVLQYLDSRRRGHLAVEYDWRRIGRFAVLLAVVMVVMMHDRSLGFVAEVVFAAGVATLAIPAWYLTLPRTERGQLELRVRSALRREKATVPGG